VKYLIVGLGNHGPEYENTRHNIGFKILDSIISEYGDSFEKVKHGLSCRIKYKGRTLVCLKPTTFMNLSGKAVSYWMNQEKISVDNLIIITDDFSLSFGHLRLRSKGSSGGHNGLKDVSSCIGGDVYPRLRFGIGNDFVRGFQTDYVLSKWSEDQLVEIDKKIEDTKKTVLSFCTIGIDRTMNSLSRK
jgi:PTH1 family peptidyl-tRNA hydrolase